MADATTAASIATATPAAAASNLQAGQANLKIGYDTFLKLLTTQLQHQDPTSPLDTNQFTSQLVQMTGVQQQLLSNELLQSLVNQGSGGQGVGSAVNLIGKTVHATGDTVALDGGRGRWSYALAEGAKSATLTVKNSSGAVVYTGDAADLGQGRHDFSWDGKDSSGRQLADGGLYTLSVSAVDANGAAVKTATEVTGAVTSVEVVDGATVLNLGRTKVLFSALNQVEATPEAKAAA